TDFSMERQPGSGWKSSPYPTACSRRRVIASRWSAPRVVPHPLIRVVHKMLTAILNGTTLALPYRPLACLISRLAPVISMRSFCPAVTEQYSTCPVTPCSASYWLISTSRGGFAQQCATDLQRLLA